MDFFYVICCRDATFCQDCIIFAGRPFEASLNHQNKSMKTKITLIFLLSLMFNLVQAQNTETKKLDRIIRKDYQIIDCTISKMSDQAVEYSLPNETMVISLDIKKIARIDFASGRSQTFDEPKEDVVPAVSSEGQTTVEYPAKQANTIAVLPVPYVNSETLASSEEMAKFAQNDIYNKLIEKASNIYPLSVQDLRTTNGLLRKAGIDYRNIDEIPVNELEDILGVDNIVAAKVSYTLTENTSSSTYKSGETKYDQDKTKNQNYASTSSQVEKVYKYHVYFDMYREGQKIYTQSRQPFFTMEDSWKDAVQYLLKRSPVYTK